MRFSQLSPAQQAEVRERIRADLTARGIDVEAAVKAHRKASTFDFEAMPPMFADHVGQSAGWQAKTRKLALVAGNQSGKTDFSTHYALRQLGRRGPGQALVCAPTFPLLIVALQPRLVDAIESRGLGEHKKGDGYIHVPYDSLRRAGYEGDEKGALDIFLRHTSEAKHVEAVTALWAIAEECGQMPDEVGEAIEARISATGGDWLGISRPYFDNWFRRMCETPDHETTVVNFASWDNPGWRADLRKIPGALQAEIERLKCSMPGWRFLMRYGGVFTRPAGAIIDNWRAEYEFSPFLVPGDWRRFTFHDFGQVHAFVLSVAEHPTEKDRYGYPVLYVYRETFPDRAISTKDLVNRLRATEQGDMDVWAQVNGVKPLKWAPRGIGGNATSEEGWRESYTRAGLPVEKPRLDRIEPQIDALYACIGRGGLRISKDCPVLLQMLKSWSWEIDDGGEPIPGKVKDDAKFHGPAALRYGVSQLRPNRLEPKPEEKAFPMGSFGYNLNAKPQTAWNG